MNFLGSKSVKEKKKPKPNKNQGMSILAWLLSGNLSARSWRRTRSKMVGFTRVFRFDVYVRVFCSFNQTNLGLFIFYKQLRRQARLRREYLYRKSTEDKERVTYERKKKLKTALEGKRRKLLFDAKCTMHKFHWIWRYFTIYDRNESLYSCLNFYRNRCLWNARSSEYGRTQPKLVPAIAKEILPCEMYEKRG